MSASETFFDSRKLQNSISLSKQIHKLKIDIVTFKLPYLSVVIAVILYNDYSLAPLNLY